MDVEIYLDLDESVEDQLFDIFGDKITGDLNKKLNQSTWQPLINQLNYKHNL